MTSPTDPTNDPFEEQLRQLLKAEADTVKTSPEALNLIRERTERNRGSIWFGLPWLRPALAVAGATLIAASVIMSSPQVRDHVLEIVPAGADREGTLTEQGQGDDVTVPDPSTDSVDGATQPEPAPPEDPTTSPGPEVEEESSPSEEDLETASTCPESVKPSPTATSGGDGKEAAAAEEGCEPVEEPSTGTGTGGTDDGESGGDTDEDGAGAGDGTPDSDGESGETGGGEESGGTSGSSTTGGDTTSKSVTGD